MIRKLLLISAVGFSVVVAALVGVRLYLTNARLTAIVQNALKENVPFPVQLGGIELSLTSGIVLRHIVVGPPTPAYHENVAVIEEVRVGYSLGGLLKRQLKVTEVVLDRANVVVEQQEGKWNVVAMGDAFASTGPVEPPPPPPEPEKPSEEKPLPVKLELERLAVIGFAAKVVSPDMSASIDRLNIDVRGAYAGDVGNAVVGLHLGEEAVWSHVTASLKDQGEVQLDTKLDCAVNAPSLKEAKVECGWRFDKEQGRFAGMDVPTVPIELKLKADANLLTQNATLENLSLIVGKALSFEAVAKAREILGDPEVGLEKLALHVHLGPALQLAPRGLVPVTAKGFVSVELAPFVARVSTLQNKKPFDGGAAIKLTDVDVTSGDNQVEKINVDLDVAFKQAEGILVALKTRVGEVINPQAKVQNVRVGVNTTLPWTIVEQKLEEPALVHTTVDVGHVDAKAKVDDVSLKVQTKLYSLTGDKLDTTVALDVARVEYVDPAQGTIVVPVTFRTEAEVRGTTYRARGLALDIAGLLKLGLDASVTMKPKGAMDLDVALKLHDLPLDRVAGAVPGQVKAQLASLALKGSVSADVKLKGPLPPNAFSGDVVTLAEAGTPFVLDASLAWKDIGLVSGPNVIDGASGALSLHTRPKQEKIALDVSVASVAAADDTRVKDVALNVAGEYAKGTGGLGVSLKVGEVTAPKSLAVPLKNTNVAIDAEYERGGELELKRFAVTVPSVGMLLTVAGKLLKPEAVVANKAWEDPEWAGLQAQLGVKLDIKFPGQFKPLAQPLVVSGGLGMDFDAAVADGVVKTSGALRFDRLSLDNAGLVVKNLRGKLPFVQDLRQVNGKVQPVFSNEDILRQKPRIAYYHALRSYGRDDGGLRIELVKQGRTEISNIAFNGRLERGMLLVDHFGLNTLSGDVGGQLALQLSADKALRVTMGAEFSDLDVSVLSKTKPGPDSQINGNMQLNLEWSEKVHELDGVEFNLTRIGRTLLVQSLLAMDPEEKDESLKKQRGQIEFYRIQIKLLKASVIHNIAKVYMEYGSIADLVGWKPIPEKLIPPTNITPYLEQHLAGPLEDGVGPILGWRSRKKGPAAQPAKRSSP